jgi:hypothetical protein
MVEALVDLVGLELVDRALERIREIALRLTASSWLSYERKIG